MIVLVGCILGLALIVGPSLCTDEDMLSYTLVIVTILSLALGIMMNDRVRDNDLLGRGVLVYTGGKDTKLVYTVPHGKSD